MSKVIITGASGEFGKLTAQALRSKGHQVFSTMRDVGGKNRKNAQALTELGCLVGEMDVTNDQSVNKAIDAAVLQMKGVDAVINNAGQGVLGLQESFTSEDWKKVFDVNVFGVQRVCRATIPYFKEKNLD
jgi:NADP-dependent 3-hydroxy acid dehydrogenase YdfG